MKPEFTNEELYAISLCVGWIYPLSEGETPEALHRRKYATRALDAFRRVLGEGFHATLHASIPEASQ